MVKRPPSRARLTRELMVARAQLAAIDRLVGSLPTAAPPGRFVQCWAVSRGYSSVTQALDDAGQVWERHAVVEKRDGASVLKESWWEKIPMERRDG